MQSDGIKEVYEKKEYPITPEYVSSFAVSTDYKKDNSLIRPVSELSPGLGDVRDIQRMADVDSMEIERLTKQYNVAVSKLKQKLMQNKATGTQATGTQATGTQATGTQATGTQTRPKKEVISNGTIIHS